MILSDLFSDHQIPLEKWVQDATNWIGENGRPVFQVIRWPVDRLLDWLTQGLEGLPPLVFLAILFLLVWRLARLRLAILSVVAFLFIGFIGQWDYTMVTIAMVLTALLLCVVIG
ncbi:MAG: glycine/betaine ABC transporter permease, partial [Acidimicrobiia bacterium]